MTNYSDFYDYSGDVRVVVIGDSMSAVQPLVENTWPNVWAEAMRSLGVNVDLSNLAVSGSTFYRANTNTTNYSGITMVQRCIDLVPDVVFVALGINDTVGAVDGRTLAQTQADATTTLTTLRAGLPSATIIMVNQLFYDSGNFPNPNTTLLNKGVYPGLFTKASAGILAGLYSAEIMDTDVGATTRQRYADWVSLMATCNAHTGVTSSYTLDVWRLYRLGLAGTEGTHFSAPGHRMLAGHMIKAAQTNSALLAKWPAISLGTFSWWADPNEVFTNVLVASGNGWITNTSAAASDWVNKHAGFGSVLRPDTWWAPSGGEVKLSNLSLTSDPTIPTYWRVTNARPLAGCSVSLNGGAFGADTNKTDAYGNALFMANAAVLAPGSYTLRYKVGDEVFGPFTQTYGTPSISWTNLTLNQGSATTGQSTPGYYVDKFNVLRLRGGIDHAVITGNFFFLPVGARPPAACRIAVAIMNSTNNMQFPVQLVINPSTGAATLLGDIPTGGYSMARFSLDGISIPLS